MSTSQLSNPPKWTKTQANLVKSLIEQLLAKDIDLQTQINNIVVGGNGSGANITVGVEFPSNPTEGQLFYNLNTGLFYLYDGTQWIVIGPTTVPTDLRGYGTVLYGLLADRPAFGVVGRLYYCTDTDYIFLDTGTAWVPIKKKFSDEEFNFSGAGVIVINTLSNRPTFGIEGRIFYASDSGETYLDTGTEWILIQSNQTGGSGLTPEEHALIDHAGYGIFLTGLDASKPSFGKLGRVYYATDTKNTYLDTGISWLLLASSQLANLNGKITTTQITDAAITTPLIAANAVVSTIIAANAITSAKIASEAVTAEKLAANSVTAGKISANAVDANAIAAGAVTATKIYAGAVSADKIQAGAVTASKLAANSVTASAIDASVISALGIWAGTIVGETFMTAYSGDRAVLNGSGLHLYGSALMMYDPYTGAYKGYLHASGSVDGIVLGDAANIYINAGSYVSIGTNDSEAMIEFRSPTVSINGLTVDWYGNLATTGIVQAGDFKASDGSSGVTVDVEYIKAVAWNGYYVEYTTGILSFKNGLLVSAT